MEMFLERRKFASVLVSLTLALFLVMASCAPSLEPAPTPSSEPSSEPAPTPSPESALDPAPEPTPESEVTPEESSNVAKDGPMLSGILKRNCQDTQLSLSDNYDEAGLQVGEKAIDFRLTDINSTEFQLSQLLVEKPVVMVFGSFT